jgi:cobalt/nickel transport system permease protein
MEKGFHFAAPMQDYGLKGVPDIVGYIMSAILGVAVFVIAYKLLGLIKKDKEDGAAKAGA